MYTSKGQLIADKGKHYIPLTLLLGKFNTPFVPLKANKAIFHMSHFAYACITERQNGISRLIFELLRTLDSSLRDRIFVLQNEVF